MCENFDLFCVFVLFLIDICHLYSHIYPFTILNSCPLKFNVLGLFFLVEVLIMMDNHFTKNLNEICRIKCTTLVVEFVLWRVMMIS